MFHLWRKGILSFTVLGVLSALSSTMFIGCTKSKKKGPVNQLAIDLAGYWVDESNQNVVEMQGNGFLNTKRIDADGRVFSLGMESSQDKHIFTLYGDGRLVATSTFLERTNNFVSDPSQVTTSQIFELTKQDNNKVVLKLVSKVLVSGQNIVDPNNTPSVVYVRIPEKSVMDFRDAFLKQSTEVLAQIEKGTTLKMDNLKLVSDSYWLLKQAGSEKAAVDSCAGDLPLLQVGVDGKISVIDSYEPEPKHIADIAANGSVTVVPSALEDSNLAQVQAEAFLSPDGQILNFVPTLIKGKNGVDLLQEGLLPKTGFFIQFERISSEDLKAKIVEQSRNNPNCASEAGK